MICGTEWDMRNMMPSLQDGDNAAFLRVLPTRGQRAYKMAALPKRWRRGSFFLYNVDVTHKMATRQAVLPTRWRRYQQDGGFTHKMPTKWRQCRVSASFTHKMAACIQYGGVTHKMVALPTRCLQDGDSVVFLRVLPQDGGVHTRWWRYPKDGGVGVFFPIKCRHYPQDGGFTIRWRRGSFAYKMAGFWEFTYKMVALRTRWWLYPQDAYKMATVPRFCEFYQRSNSCDNKKII